MSTLEIRDLPVDELVPYAGNAKEHPDWQVERICRSIQDFGFADPVGIWHGGDGRPVIVEGHGRVLAAKRLGMEAVPTVCLDHMTDEERRAYAIAHNSTNMDTGFNEDALARELALISDVDMAAFGIDPVKALEAVNVEEDDIPAPADVPAIVEPGELWRLGDHILVCGDATDHGTIQRLIAAGGGVKADLLLTDPPYNVDVGSCARPNSSNDGVHIMNDKMPEGPFIEFLASAFGRAVESMRPGAAFYIFYAGLNHTAFDLAIRQTPDMYVHEQLVWAKSHFVLGRNSDYQWAHEPAFYGWKTGAAHYFLDSRAESTVIEDQGARLSTLKKGELIELVEKLMGEDQSTTVLRADKPAAADLHPTVKPVALFARLIRNSTRPGETVLDPFMGSGTTIIAAEQMGRRAIGCELDPHYCDVIVNRWQRLTGREASRGA